MIFNLKYHPKYFYKTRPFAGSIVNFYRQVIGRDLPDMDQMNALMRKVGNSYNDEILKLEFEQRPRDMSVLFYEFNLAVHFAQYYMHGQNIFNFNNQMVTEFLHTDFADIKMSDINCPYKVFYIYFGIKNQIELMGENCLADGAYVNFMSPENLTIIITTKQKDMPDIDKYNFITMSSPYYAWHFKKNNDDIGRTVSDAVKDYIDQERPFDIPNKKDAEIENVEIDGENITVINKMDTKSSFRTSIATKQYNYYSSFEKVLNIIFNGLCFLTAYKKSVVKKYPDDAPRSLLKKIEDSKPNKRKKYIKQLAQMGFTKINFCGFSTEHERSNIPTGKEVCSHWRCGHWRNQAYGENHSKRRMILIRPVLVRADKGEPRKGHIYKVEKDYEIKTDPK